MLRQDGERKAQLLKQADRDKRALTKHAQDMQTKYDESCAKLYQVGQDMNALKAKEDPEKVRLRAQNEKLQSLCRLLRQEKKDVAPASASETAAQPSLTDGHTDASSTVSTPATADEQNGASKVDSLQQNASAEHAASSSEPVSSPENPSSLTQ